MMPLRTLVVFAVLLVAAVAAVPFAQDESPDNVEWLNAEFSRFESQFNRTYTDDDAREWRKSVFRFNLERAVLLQQENPNATFGVTKFSDYTPDEFAKLQGKRPDMSPPKTEADYLSTSDLPRGPDQVDWRKEGLVTPVKDQGQCGSCWSFGTTGVIEGAWAKAGNKLTSLSEKEFMDCDTVDGSCDGGNQDLALKFALKHWKGEVEPEAAYPYKPKDGKCKRDAKKVGAVLKSWKEVPHTEEALADAVAAYGPVTVGVAADNSWMNYKSGVICKKKHRLDHAVLVVGYDKTASPPYWIVKNSWAADWGESGYVRVEMGKKCYGIQLDAQAAFA